MFANALTAVAYAKHVSKWAACTDAAAVPSRVPDPTVTIHPRYGWVLLDVPEEGNSVQAKKDCWYDFHEGLSLYTARIVYCFIQGLLSLKPQVQESSLIGEILFTLSLYFTLELCQLPKKNLCFMEEVRRFALRSSHGYCRQVNKSKVLVSPGRVTDGQSLMVLRLRYWVKNCALAEERLSSVFIVDFSVYEERIKT